MGVDAVERAHIDDPAPAPLLHAGEDCLHGPERRLRTYAPGPVGIEIAERFDLGKAGLAAGAPAPGIVDEDVDMAEPRQGGIDHALHGGVLAHIGHGMSHLSAKFGADFCGDPGTGFGIGYRPATGWRLPPQSGVPRLCQCRHLRP